MKNVITATLILILAGCTVMINENDYRSLDSNKLSQIHPFDPNQMPKEGRNAEKVNLYEINSPQILNLAKQEGFLWLHIWNPCCSGSSCINIQSFEDELNKHENTNLRLLFVSESYDFRCINSVTRNSHFEHPIYVLEDAYYGHKCKEITQNLQADLTQKEYDKTEGYFNDYVFIDGELMYSGRGMKPAVLDSLANTISN